MMPYPHRCGKIAGMFSEYLRRWDLTPDGHPILTNSSRLLPVCRRGMPAMLKVAVCSEERRGNAVMTWWDGVGAALVLEHDDDALLLERAHETPSLAGLAANANDDEAIRVACEVIAGLHTPRAAPPPSVVPLSQWFAPLTAASRVHGGILPCSAVAATELLSSAQDDVVLHGDVHHGNILHFGKRGWLAIDPKGLSGERGFDYANLFCNPSHAIAANPDRFARRIAIVTDAAALDRKRLLQWILAWGGLSAAWMLEDGLPPSTALEVARMAAAELDRMGDCAAS